MEGFADAMQKRKDQSLAKKDGIARMVELHKQYMTSVSWWDWKQSKIGTKNLLWKNLEDILVRSRNEDWTDKGLPTNEEVRTALNITGNKKIEEILASKPGNGESDFVEFARSVDQQRRQVEIEANRLRNYVLYGSADIEKAADAKHLEEQPFFTAFRDLDYKNQLRVACHLTQGLHRTKVGKQLLADLLFYLPFRFLDFFEDPGESFPDFTTNVADDALTVVKPLAGSYLRSPQKLKRELNPVVVSLIQLAQQLLAGINHQVVRNKDDPDARREAHQAFGTILDLFFDSANVFNEQAVNQYLPSTTHSNVLKDLSAGGIPLSEIGGLVPAYIGKSESILSTLSTDTGWLQENNPARQAVVGLKGFMASAGAVVHVLDRVEKYQEGNYQPADGGEDFTVIVKAFVDTSLSVTTLTKLGSKGFTKALNVVGLIMSGYDMVMNLFKAVDAYDRNDLSVAVGFGIAGLGTYAGIVGGLILIGQSNPIGWGLAIAGAAIALAGLTIADVTQDTKLLRWIRRCWFGRLYPGLDSNKPDKYYYNYADDDAGDELTAQARMTGTFYGFVADESVESVEVFDRRNDPEPSQLKITLDNVVLNSNTDIFIQPILNKGNGEYETQQFQHVIHLANMTNITNYHGSPPLDTKLGEEEHDPLDPPDAGEPSKGGINIWEDLSADSFSIEHLLGIDRATLQKREGHYLEIGIIPGSLKEDESNSLGPLVQGNSVSEISRAYNRVPIMVRDRKEIEIK